MNMFENCLWLFSFDGAPLLTVVPALVLGAALYLFLATKVELRLAGRRTVTRPELEAALRTVTSEVEELRAHLTLVERECSLAGQSAALESLRHAKWPSELEEVRARLRELERERRSLAEAGAEPDYLNLNRRAQILSLHRKGKRVPEIAAALRIPQGEVELMVKVHDLSQSASREIQAISSL
jgi:DNA-binding NarL/FixJ family response regulator